MSWIASNTHTYTHTSVCLVFRTDFAPFGQATGAWPAARHSYPPTRPPAVTLLMSKYNQNVINWNPDSAA